MPRKTLVSGETGGFGAKLSVRFKFPVIRRFTLVRKDVKRA